MLPMELKVATLGAAREEEELNELRGEAESLQQLLLRTRIITALRFLRRDRVQSHEARDAEAKAARDAPLLSEMAASERRQKLLAAKLSETQRALKAHEAEHEHLLKKQKQLKRATNRLEVGRPPGGNVPRTHAFDLAAAALLGWPPLFLLSSLTCPLASPLTRPLARPFQVFHEDLGLEELTATVEGAMERAAARQARNAAHDGTIHDGARAGGRAGTADAEAATTALLDPALVAESIKTLNDEQREQLERRLKAEVAALETALSPRLRAPLSRPTSPRDAASSKPSPSHALTASAATLDAKVNVSASGGGGEGGWLGEARAPRQARVVSSVVVAPPPPDSYAQMTGLAATAFGAKADPAPAPTPPSAPPPSSAAPRPHNRGARDGAQSARGADERPASSSSQQPLTARAALPGAAPPEPRTYGTAAPPPSREGGTRGEGAAGGGGGGGGSGGLRAGATSPHLMAGGCTSTFLSGSVGDGSGVRPETAVLFDSEAAYAASLSGVPQSAPHTARGASRRGARGACCSTITSATLEGGLNDATAPMAVSANSSPRRAARITGPAAAAAAAAAAVAVGTGRPVTAPYSQILAPSARLALSGTSSALSSRGKQRHADVDDKGR